MNPFLVFQLHGPLSAWGAIAVGEQRVATRIPSRSGVLGLLGAALGLRREDPRLSGLHAGYGVATRTDGVGALLVDYHTTQTAPAALGKKRRLRTRREELRAAGEDVKTSLSSREYWSDLVHVVCVWARDPAPWSLPALADALRHPHFPLYLGRRSCPPSLPLAPRVVEGEDPVAVLRAWEAPPLLAALDGGPTSELGWEEYAVDLPHTEHVRRDDPGPRAAWVFQTRIERRATVPRGRHAPQ